MDFMNAVKQQNKTQDHNKILTTNGAIAYSSLLNHFVDFNYGISNERYMPKSILKSRFAKLYDQNPVLATKLLFKIGDVRQGDGERNIFKAGLEYLAEEHPYVATELLNLIPEYSRFDYAIELATSLNPYVAKEARNFVVNTIQQDLDTLENNKKADKEGGLTLCAKWMPSIQSKKAEDRKLALKLETALNPIMSAHGYGTGHRAYRHILSDLRGELNIIEKRMSQKTMDELSVDDLSKLTSKQLLNNEAALKEKLGDKWDKYQEKVANGEAEMNSSVNTPADIVNKYTINSFRVNDYSQNLENLWNNLNDTMPDGVNAIVIRDGSGSMTSSIPNTSLRPLDIATALSIYMAEKLPGALKDKFITFSSKPEIVDMSNCNSLHDKLKLCYTYNDYSNTDIEATFDLLLDTIVANNMSQNDIPKNCVIVSDMEFDQGTYQYSFTSDDKKVDAVLFESIKEKWNNAGYEMPTLIYWNVNTDRNILPMMDAQKGVILASGYSTNNLDLILGGDFGEQYMEEQLMTILSKERYDAVEAAVNTAIETEKHFGTNGLCITSYEKESLLHNFETNLEIENDFDEYDEDYDKEL